MICKKAEKATELYNQKGIEAAGEIIELFDKPLNNIVQKFKSVPKFKILLDILIK